MIPSAFTATGSVPIGGKDYVISIGGGGATVQYPGGNAVYYPTGTTAPTYNQSSILPAGIDANLLILMLVLGIGAYLIFK